MYGTLYRHLLFPAFDRIIKRRRTLDYWAAAEQSQWWPLEKLQELQLRALRDLLAHAQETCDHYRTEWQTRDLGPESLESLDDFTRWPLLTKEVFRMAPERLCSSVDYRTVAKATGGSTGEPVRFILNHDSRDRRTAMMYRGYGWAGGAPGSKQLHIWGRDVGSVPPLKKFKQSLHRRIDRHRLVSCFDFTPALMLEHLATLDAYQPEVIVAYTNPLYEFARYLSRHKLAAHTPQSIIVGAEKLHDFQRELIEEVFGAPVFETYGSREFMLIGAECERHTGLHLSMENLIVEVVDDDGRPLPAGEEGNVVVTDLFNYAMPFIRYVTGDRAVAGYQMCPCGRGLPLLRQVTGRRLDVLHTPDGRQVPGELFPHLLKDFAWIERFQVIQSAEDRITIKLVVGEGFDDAERAMLLSELYACVGAEVHIDLQLVDDIPLTAAGKHRVVLRQC